MTDNNLFIYFLIIINMNYIIALFLLNFFTTYQKTHTKVYIDFLENNNDNKLFFDHSTFGINLYTDPCTPIKTNNHFRKYIIDHSICDGKWCVDAKFKCLENKKADCYHVEHIIDVRDGEFSSCKRCKNIAANFVMAWGRWNMALGGLNYTNSIKEKENVYGKDLVDRIRNKIYECYPEIYNTEIYTDDSYCDNIDNCNCDTDSICGCECSGLINNNSTLDNSSSLIIEKDLILIEYYTIGGIVSFIIILIGAFASCIYLFRRNKIQMNKYQSLVSM